MNTDIAKNPAPRRARASTRPEFEAGAAVSGSLSRGLQVLDVLRQARGFLSLSDIAAETGLDASTAHRLVQVLTENGYAVRDDIQKCYLPGPRALSPLSLFHPLTQLRMTFKNVTCQARARCRRCRCFIRSRSCGAK
ncbi:helix-turn-helix domain-containing protein [Stenotrophomonas sp. YIM B06876]|uniref:helix-turn-helix domain-containing protein n=1 Tax=Stenotrophomonas sp. YIM B06876 TaxID=3060211 RepID=UPI002739C131|nr:helix-turn-helix domain-containing protein [Stenotrophomonas sp. YIM B06876]